MPNVGTNEHEKQELIGKENEIHQCDVLFIDFMIPHSSNSV
jgi:uncharacterized protein (DUF305 family)